MNRKFKHKKTGKIIEERNYYFDSEAGIHIPQWLLENSKEWEEITNKPIYLKWKFNDSLNGSVKKGTIYEAYLLEFATITMAKFINSNGQNDILQVIYFEPSTKEEYDKQFIKDYEILSLIGNSNNSLFKDVIIKCDNIFNKKEPNDYWSIHSIKRLSDEEIFTIGDILDGSFDKQCKIEKIEIKDNQILLYYDKVSISMLLIDAKHSKKSLFITEDGKEIFEGNNYWFIGNFSTPIKALNVKSTDIDLNDIGIKRFSTEQAAKDYIIMNKPCLSINDFYSLSHYQAEEEKTFNKLKELVKSKLNL